jgi:hypothetical protein
VTARAAAQPQEHARQVAAFQEGGELVFAEPRQFTSGAGLAMRDEAGRVLLHQAVQRGPLRAVALVVHRALSGRAALWLADESLPLAVRAARQAGACFVIAMDVTPRPDTACLHAGGGRLASAGPGSAGLQVPDRPARTAESWQDTRLGPARFRLGASKDCVVPGLRESADSFLES